MVDFVLYTQSGTPYALLAVVSQLYIYAAYYVVAEMYSTGTAAQLTSAMTAKLLKQNTRLLPPLLLPA